MVKKAELTKAQQFAIVKGIKKRNKDWTFGTCEWCDTWCVVNDGVSLHPLCAEAPGRARAIKKAPDPNQSAFL